GAQRQRDADKEESTLDRLRLIAPSAVERFKSATLSMDYRDYSGAALLFHSVLDRAPEFEPAIVRLGFCLSYSGRNREALALLQKAVKNKRSAQTLATLAELLAYPAKSSDGVYQQNPRPSMLEAFGLAKEAYAEDSQDDSIAAVLLARLSLDLDEKAE